jgi:hypothetical protein
VSPSSGKNQSVSPNRQSKSPFPEAGISSIDWSQLSGLFAWGWRQSPASETSPKNLATMDVAQNICHYINTIYYSRVPRFHGMYVRWDMGYDLEIYSSFAAVPTSGGN